MSNWARRRCSRSCQGEKKGQAFGLLPAHLGRNAVDGLVEADMGALPGEQLHQVIAEDRVGVHGGDGSALPHGKGFTKIREYIYEISDLRWRGHQGANDDKC